MPPYCDKHKMHYEMVYVNGMPWQECVCTACEFEKESGFNLMAQAPEPTESPSKAAADKGLILTEEELKERNRLLVLENDEQQTEIARLVVLLMRTLPYIEPEIEQSGYGFFPGGNPTLFTPDSENTELEIDNWKKACDLWNESQIEAASSHVNLVNDKGDYMGSATIANLGMGIYRYEDEEAKSIVERIREIGDEMHE